MKRSMAVVLMAAMLASMPMEAAFAAEGDSGASVVSITPREEEVLPDAKLPTTEIDFNEYKQSYINTVLQVPVYLYNADIDDTYSMGNPALVHTAYIMVNDDGEATVKLQFQGMEYGGSYGHLKRASYFESREDMEKWETGEDTSTKKDVEIERMDDSDNIEQISFQLPSGDPQVYVTVIVDAMNNSEVSARLGFDYTNIKVLEGKELTQFYVDQFEKNVNSTVYTDKYTKVYESNVFLAKKYLNSSNISDEDITNLNKQLSYNYDNREYYLRENALRSSCETYLKEEQGDFTEESFQNLQNVAANALANLDAGMATGGAILRLENQVNKAVRGLTMQEGKEAYSSRLQKYVEKINAMNPDDYLPSSWEAFQTNYMRSARQYAESGDEIQCRSALQDVEEGYQDYVFPKRTVLTEEGNYEVTVTPKLKQEDGSFVETDILDEYMDFSQPLKLTYYQEKPTLYLNLNDKEDFPYASVSLGTIGGIGWDHNMTDGVTYKKVDFEEGAYDDQVQTCVSLRMPTQSELKDVYIQVRLIDKNGKTVEIDGQSANYTIYLDIDFENAVRTGDIEVDKTQLREEIDLFVNQIDPNYVDEQDLIDVMYNEMGYTMESAKAMANALVEAENVYFDMKATQNEVDAAYQKIESTYDSMQQYTDAYEAVYEQALEILSVSSTRSLYTEDSIENLSNAFDKAFAEINDAAGGLSRADYEAQTAALQEALDNLKKIGEETVDKTALNEKLKEVKEIKADGYTADSYQALQDAITAAEAVANDPDATQEAVNAQVAALEAAVEGLVEEAAVDKAALNGKLAEAKEIKADGYTADSYQALQDAIAAAEAVANDPDATQEAVNAQVTALETAIKGLVEDTQTGEIADGTYSIPVSLWHATNNQASMGNAAVDQTAILQVKDGEGKLYLNFHSMTIGNNLSGYLSQLDLIENIEFNQYGYPIKYDKIPAEVISTYDVIDDFNGPDSTDENAKGKMYPKELSIPVTLNQEYTWVHVYVPIMGSLGSGDQVARIKLDYSNLVKIETVDKEALNNKLAEAKEIKADGYTVDSYQALQDAIVAAETVANDPDATQEAVNAQVAALEAAVEGLMKENTDPSTPSNPSKPDDNQEGNGSIGGNGNSSQVDTGDHTAVAGMGILALASAVGAIFLKKRRTDKTDR